MSEYLGTIGEPGRDYDQLPPNVRSLYGVLKGSNVDEADYKA